MKYLIYLGLIPIAIGVNHAFSEFVKNLFGLSLIASVISVILSFAMGFYLGIVTILIEEKIKQK